MKKKSKLKKFLKLFDCNQEQTKPQRPIPQNLDEIFAELRRFEHFEPNEFILQIGAKNETKILLNRKWKIFCGLTDEVTEEENEIYFLESPLVIKFIHNIFYNLELDTTNSLPYPEVYQDENKESEQVL